MRIALCLFGQIRDLQEGYKDYSHHLLSKYNIDVFAHVWNSDEASTLLEIYNPVSSKIESQVDFNMHLYPEAYGLEPWHNASREKTFTSISQLYSFNEVCKLRQDYEAQHHFNYHLCIKGRLDTWFKAFDANLLNIDPQQYCVPSDPQGFIYNDVLAIASPNIMDIVAQRYSKLDEWYNSGDYNFIPEYTTQKILKQNNIDIYRHPGIACDLCRVK